MHIVTDTQTHLPDRIWKGFPSLINLSSSIVNVGALAAAAHKPTKHSRRSRIISTTIKTFQVLTKNNEAKLGALLKLVLHGC